MTVELYHPGLRGVVVGETEISRLEGGLQYRGYCIYDLAEQASFCEVLHLLLYDELPSPDGFADFRSILTEEAELPLQVQLLFEHLPLHSQPLEAVRTGISLLAHFDPQPDDDFQQAAEAQAVRLVSRIPLLVAAWHSQRRGLPAVSVDPDYGFAANLLLMLLGRSPTPLEERALDAALVVCAEQEFNAAAYAARVAASTQANLYSAILAGMSTVMGPASGGNLVRVLDLLDSVGDVDDVPDWLARQPADAPLPGFGHPVYADCDPRAAILERYCCELAGARNNRSLEEKADAIERAVWETRRLPPNMDWPLARLLHYLSIPADLHLPVFVCSRAAGWCAHAIEQARDGEAIRPRARYRGAEDLTFTPLYDRG
ncbi:MAG: citrate/2-methylcitrate synthase [Planctomycetaceae bacterium]|nr:citrate/2-methylcitrate synthase [Planctomycetaceae bacterium]